MGQTWTDNTYDPAHVADTDLANMEANFASLKSSFSGTSSPASAVTGQLHMDTDNHVLKLYDTSWLGLMHGDTSQKIWVYRNSAMPGWAIDSSVQDVVIAAKGASGSVYETAGTTAGSWTVSGMSHIHQVYDHVGTTGNDKVYNSAGVATEITVSAGGTATANYKTSGGMLEGPLASRAGWTFKDLYTSSGGSDSDATWRVAAAVNTLQYLDI